ncbi:PEGA domain-containing protein [Archangium lansingense]|uniref:PEGA domain-containing protein n=1 Tax=Archangium lansingense TaxID=2995310 RepID=A0ABT4AMH6_9BACT|nr:PEGA domain-containing protein [Archangium lansinium]MCY1082883.1 PEGA domain-containing protein [Archangium lansinium]
MSGTAPKPAASSPPEAGGAGGGAAPAPPVRPVAPVAAPAGNNLSRDEGLAAGLKLASALCALVAVGLFVRPLLQGELSMQPRMITLQPTFTATPVEAPSEGKGDSPTPAPRELPRDTVTREERADFDGAILMVESEPSGATILVDGKDQGETPVSVGLECLPGTPVLVELSLRGYEKAKHRTLCPHDALVKVTARLRKGSGKSSGKK